MVKLIRLQGDANVNQEEIRNKFKQPIILEKNAKVALVGASAVLADEIVNENFVISSTNKYFKIGHKIGLDTDKLYQAEIATGSYSASQFVEEFGTAANISANDTSAFFMTHQTSIVGNKFQLETHRCLLSSANFTDATLWEVYAGSGTKTATTLTAGAAGISVSTGQRANSSIPMFHNRMEGKLVDVSGGATFEAVEYDQDAGEPINTCWGLKVNASNQYYAFLPDPEGNGPPSEISLAASWAANDTFSIITFGGRLLITIKSSAGATKVSYNQAVIPRVYYEPSAYGKDWAITLTASGANIADMQTTTLINLPDQGIVGDVNTNGLLQFADPTNKYNVILATFAGFGMNGSSIIPYNGNPATLEGRDELAGLASYPGILVEVNGLGPLESYDGSSDSRSQSNIVYVLNDLSVVTSNVLQLDIPAPFFLNLNNASRININELRARFLPSSGSLTNHAISFAGKPSLTLLIDG